MRKRMSVIIVTLMLAGSAGFGGVWAADNPNPSVMAPPAGFSGLGTAENPYTAEYNRTLRPVAAFTDNATGETTITWVINGGIPVEGSAAEIPEIRNAGYYFVEYTVRNSGYDDMSGSFVLKIEPKEVELVWGDSMFTYNGDLQCPKLSLLGIEGGDTCLVSVTGGAVDAGEHTAVAEQLSNHNYKLPEENTKVFTINKKNLVINAASASKTFGDTNPVFTGTASGFVNYTDSMAAEIKYSRISGNEGEDTYESDITAEYNPDIDKNYNVTVNNADFTIDAISDKNVDTAVNYISGKNLILTFINSDNVVCRCEGKDMIELKGYGYSSSDSKYYKHVFGFVTESINPGIEYIFRAINSPCIEYTADINGSGDIDINDLSVVSGIYNNSFSDGFSMMTLLRANYSAAGNTVDITDINTLRRAILESMI